MQRLAPDQVAGEARRKKRAISPTDALCVPPEPAVQAARPATTSAVHLCEHELILALGRRQKEI